MKSYAPVFSMFFLLACGTDAALVPVDDSADSADEAISTQAEAEPELISVMLEGQDSPEKSEANDESEDSLCQNEARRAGLTGSYRITMKYDGGGYAQECAKMAIGTCANSRWIVCELKRMANQMSGGQ